MPNDGTAHFLVKLNKGPAWTPGVTLSLLALQLRHMRNLWRLTRGKGAVLAGPVSDGTDLRGIVVFNVATEQDARRLIETDPAIQAGRLAYEIIPI